MTLRAITVAASLLSLAAFAQTVGGKPMDPSKMTIVKPAVVDAGTQPTPPLPIPDAGSAQLQAPAAGTPDAAAQTAPAGGKKKPTSKQLSTPTTK